MNNFYFASMQMQSTQWWISLVNNYWLFCFLNEIFIKKICNNLMSWRHLSMLKIFGILELNIHFPMSASGPMGPECSDVSCGWSMNLPPQCEAGEGTDGSVPAWAWLLAWHLEPNVGSPSNKVFYWEGKGKPPIEKAMLLNSSCRSGNS